MTASASSSLDDPYVPLAFSMYSTPGAYAVLAGAGVSMGAGLPTAWDIVVDLAQQLCRTSDPDRADSLDASNVEDWYASTTYPQPLGYSGLLEQVAPTQHEREAVLRRFFEPQPDPHDPSAPPKTGGPSAAHTATATLMAAGVIRVVVTMNFDHLFEDALAAEGIVPTVVRTNLDAAGLPPLHTIKHLVHLHGDYRDATSMLNTGTELSGYELHKQQLLAQIVANHGLLIAGWSAEHDHALRQIVRRSYRRYYTPAWINPSALRPDAAEVATAIGALTLHATADKAFTQLADAVSAMQRRAARHPLTPAVAADRIKRDIRGDRVAITAHDTFTAEAARLDTLPELGRAVGYDTSDYEQRVEKIDEACHVPAAAIAVLARWGNTDTDEWWLPTLERWSNPTRGYDSGATKLVELPLMVGVRLFYGAAVGAVTARRYDLLARLLRHQVQGSGWRHGRACSWFAWDWRHSDLPHAVKNPMRDKLAAVLADALGLSTERLDTTWQEFETLRTAAQILSHPDFDVLMHDMDMKQGAVITAQLRVEVEGTTGDAQTTLRDATIEADRALGKLAQSSVVRDPHLWVEDMPGDNPGDDLRLRSPVALRLAERPDAFADLASLASPAVVARGGAVEIALRGAARAFEIRANKILDPHVSVAELWLDIPTGPTS